MTGAPFTKSAVLRGAFGCSAEPGGFSIGILIYQIRWEFKEILGKSHAAAKIHRQCVVVGICLEITDLSTTCFFKRMCFHGFSPVFDPKIDKCTIFLLLVGYPGVTNHVQRAICCRGLWSRGVAVLSEQDKARA